MRLPRQPSAALSPLYLLLTLPLFAPTILADDLDIQVTRPKSCSRKTHSGDKIEVHYRGTLQGDGSVFDESYKRGKPFAFTLGAGQVIAGWDEGLLDMCIGEGRKLIIPPELGYGKSGNGPIPPSATLIFETELMGIAGVDPDAEPESPPPPPPPSDEEQHGGKDGPKHPPGDNNGECRLLGSFALLIQGALGLLALLSLVWKRYRERPRRQIKVWAFDVSKQVVGSMMLHLANLFMSMLSSGDLKVAAEERLEKHKPGFANDKEMPNPCSFYLLNLAIDTTIGIPILVGLLRVLHALFLKTPIANPPESIKSGHYGSPPRATWWGKQCFIYFLGLFGMKFCVFLIFQLLPWLGWVGDWALRWTEGNEAVQIAFVMLIFPLVMNALQYYIIDSFIKDPAGGEGHDQLHSGHTSEEEEERRHLRESLDDDSDDDDYASGRESFDPRKRPSRIDTHDVALKEANPTPVPQYDPSIEASSSSSPRSTRSRTSESKELGGKR
ncbi:putative fk506-binding protein 2 precursor protein [Botryosphaeria dothidea]|uniref:peptidylprolyl isomerase n=1 Tax=Botryosphaeria dothidea TaxID=55169 RepID=A0A8H4II52_9PEZI|nr:putative fk506-binding protein 2 precursor protein [Botryosphaeria dothidea]